MLKKRVESSFLNSYYNKTKSVDFVLLFILLVAFVLRFYDAFNIPITHDEYSALNRIHFSTFNELIQKGIREDGHPAGVQVFTYYYVRLFGEQAFVLKLPYLVFGVLAVLVVYQLALLWFGKTSAVISATIYASLQYTVVNSQIARPYGFGILFCLLVAYYWTRYFYKNDTKWYYLVLLIIAAIISVYSHYFASLYVAIFLTLAVLLAKNRQQVWKLLMVGGFVILAFLPHLPITIYQIFDKGGIQGWIGPYKPTYIIVYFLIVLHQSWFLITVYLATFIFLFRYSKERLKLMLFSGGVFILSFLIGSVYSYYYMNVMHERVLYFAFPFILLSVSGFFRKLPVNKIWFLAIGLTAVTVFSLVIERKHYNLFYKNRYLMVQQKKQEWEIKLDGRNLIVLNYFKYPAQLEKKLFFEGHQYLINSSTLLPEVDSCLSSTHLQNLMFLNCDFPPPEIYPLITSYFPNVIQKEFTIGGEALLFSKSDSSKQRNQDKSEVIIYPKFPLQGNLSDWYFSKYNFIDFIVYCDTNNIISNQDFSLTIESEDKVYYKRSFVFMNRANKVNQGYASLRLIDLSFPEEAVFKVLVNKEITVDSIKISCRPGNPYLYAHVKKIPKNLDRFFLE
ncbi:MAG: hypothetical protein CVU09_06080 [Bacteroidetes bacterium HGW-Bacteroidetes-4]|jgi:hypothetical protein|nr:MAG: hypothetical protein CVU09_06080 [Bacteroidetes bacterium HGW-Bacteroidetes-4]